MNRFKLGSLANWMPVKQQCDLTAPYLDGRSAVSFVVIGQDVEVYAQTDYGVFPIAFGSGALDVDFSCDGPCVVSIMAPAASVKWPEVINVLPKSDEESYTSLEPRGPSKHPAVEALERSIAANRERRNALITGAAAHPRFAR